MHLSFNKDNFHSLCNKLTSKDKHLRFVVKQYGYPPVWTRTASFQTLIHIILEQQVSLASARAALNKLKDRLGNITPKKLLTLSDEDLKACYFSRQKTVYAKCLAQAMVSKQINLKKLSILDDAEIRQQLKTIKGIGDWTVDVYLLFALQRTDVFPLGDLAMINALKEIKQLTKETKQEEFLKLSEPWRPYRSIAAMLLWHYYIQKRGIKF
ncbi:MAG TPA: DNA-3-methyladenine glycosylase 2 family protein [Chitinophagaceae bacterium]|jgi:DNA-3-methyladenine glycosylase II|nr:DNA-3-methyladenine glycosylase 2 family protein [Chitinophagaceae bacterium]